MTRLGHALELALLAPFALLYGAAVRLRARLYRWGLLPQRRLPALVISVGNLTVGGTGKTPLVTCLAEKLARDGRQVGILTRGYRGAPTPERFRHLPGVPEWSSDEVLQYAVRLGSLVRLGVGPNRYAQGLPLVQQGVDCFLLDDGFQHLALTRHVNILVVDASNPFDNGWLLPAGSLREPPSAAARADIIVITRAAHAPAVETALRRHSTAPFFYAQTRLAGVCLEGANLGQPVAAPWQGKRLFAFCGIGNPQAFLDDLRRWQAHLVGHLAFPDHHSYTDEDLRRIAQQAVAAGAEAVICTEKDSFNYRPGGISPLPVYCAAISLELAAPELFWSALHAIIGGKPEAGR
jgi:tetraacyldisaccharide 4'-kinase